MTAAAEFVTPSQQAMDVLRALRQYRNVLIYGPPATGKSHLLAEVKYWFTHPPTRRAVFEPNGPNAFPPGGAAGGETNWTPSSDRAARRTWSTTFHQGTKYRDFVSGIMPGIGAGAPAFRVTTGPLLEAADFALTEGGASLVTVDEINRGPAVAVFGDLISAIEQDKRLRPDGTNGPETVTIRVLRGDGTYNNTYGLSPHLYLVAAMNEADTSVEPLDVAFRRRFHPFPLTPDEKLLRSFTGLPPAAQPLPAIGDTAASLYEVAVQAWSSVNEGIQLARGSEFRIGHGVFMGGRPVANTLADATSHVIQVWALVAQHVREVFFGDERGMAEVLAAGKEGSPYILHEELFADAPVARLVGPAALGPDVVYSALKAIAES